MTVVGQFPRVVREIENAWIELSDGCRLAARIWLPADAGDDPVPAILEYLPYRKRDGTAVRDELTHPYFAGHGYACLRIDMRGNGESDGLMFDEYLKQEQDDALEVIDWITAQPWCSGAVGMIGISWGGFNSLQIAARRPPALKAIITLCSTDDRYGDDIHYKGGCLLNENLGWAGTMLSFSSRPPDPALVGERWREIWLARLEATPHLAATWLKHPHRDAFWKHGSVCEDFGAIEAAVFAVGGWGDAYSNAIPRMLAGLNSPALGLTGPWVHKYPHFAVPEPRIGFLQEALRWWDHWLKDRDTGIMEEPKYRAYLQDAVPPRPYYEERAGRWIAEPSWPSPNIEPWRLHLNGDGLGNQPSAHEVRAVHSPQTTGAAGGEFCIIWLGPEAPLDQRQDDAGSLCFDSAPLTAPIELFGAPLVELSVASDRPVAFVALRLCDVAPDGAATRLSWGVLNLCHRDSHESPSPLEPDRTTRVRVQLDDFAAALPAGHRLRLSISSAYWPLIWPSPEAATLSVTCGVSSLSLPVRPARDETAPTFPPAETAPPLEEEELRPVAHSRTLEQDQASGESVLRLLDDFGEYRNKSHGLATGAVARETYRITPDDPLSAQAETHWTQTLSRDDWSVRIEAFQSQRATKTHFIVTARIEAYEGEELVFERDWAEEVPRDLL